MTDHNYIATFHKSRFDPTKPTYDDILLPDIAHALSMLTRANGHFKEFYSVARHSIFCAEEARLCGDSERIQLFCLLHDSAEAFIGDMTRPLKLYFPQFSAYEKALQQIIFQKFATLDLTQEEIDEVRRIDDTLLYHEFKAYHGDILWEDEPIIHVDVRKNTADILETEQEFLRLYEWLHEKAKL